VKQVAAIALLACRNALRSRVILVLVALLLAAVLLFPLAIRHDGTAAGLVRLHLTYTLGIAAFLLSLSSLWAGCAAVSGEADDKTLHLLLVKPVPRLRIWIGKWTALLLINAALLALVGAVSLATLHAKLRRGNFDPADLAHARATAMASLVDVEAPLPDVNAEVDSELADLRARGALPDTLAEDDVRALVRRTVLARRYSVKPRQSLTWTFGPLPAADAPLSVRFRCDASVPGAGDLPAVLRVAVGDRTMSRDIQAMPGSEQTIVFAGLAVPAGASAVVTLENAGRYDATLFFEPEDGLILRLPRGGFLGNYLRALLSLYLRLALFAALGTTLGTLFSMPVAAFLALVLLLILQLSGFISAAAQTDRATFVKNVAPFGANAHSHGHNADDQGEPSLAARGLATLLYYTYRGTWHTLRPLIEDHALDDLVAAARIPPRRVLAGVLQQGLILPSLLAFLSAAVLHKREWALPSLS